MGIRVESHPSSEIGREIMSEVDRPVRGLVLLESLRDSTFPVSLAARVVDRYDHRLGGVMPVKVYIVSLSRAELYTALFVLAELLLEKRYYAHFVDGNQLYVVYPDCVCLVRRDDSISACRCREIGRRFDIPDTQMLFNDLFEEDHPNA
jgi:hypothetical protein